MDTKWKKSKRLCGIVTFTAGLTLLSGCLAVGITGWFTGGGLTKLEELQGGWQETEEYRERIADMLNNLIRISAGQPLSWSTAYEWSGRPGSFNVGRAYEQGDGIVSEVTVTENAAWEAEAVEGLRENGENPYAAEEDLQVSLQSQDYGESGVDWKPEELKEMADSFHQSHAPDKNVLYSVKKDGKTLYDNLDGEQIGGEKNALPVGYNVFLSFDGEKVTMYQNGAAVAVYGAPEESGQHIYEPDGKHWRLPGYSNYRVPADWKDWDSCEIMMAVRETPLIYVYGDATYGGGLYDTERNFRRDKADFRLWMVLTAVSIALLILSLPFKKERRELEKRMAELLNRILPEIRFAAVLLLLLPAVAALFHNSYYDYNNVLWLISLLWTLRLIYLDFHYNGNPWKNSLLLVNRAADMKLPVQKRLVKRAVWPAAWIMISVVTAALVVFPGHALGLEDTVFAVLLILCAVSFAAGLALLIANTCRMKRLAADLGRLNDQIDAVCQGKSCDAYELPADSDLAEMAGRVKAIGGGLEAAVEERMKSERMKVELVANVSHDIKTPLTSIISYVDLLCAEENLPADVRDYVTVLAQKSERLKTMVQDIFEVSRAASGQLAVNMEKLDLCKLLRQTLADMEDEIDAAPVTVRLQIPEEEVKITADGQRMYRVFQNLIQNALKYSLDGSRVFITLRRTGDMAVASIRNTSASELSGGVDFTERFVRGDASRTDGGSGLGLSIAKSFTEACGGGFKVETIADLFVVTVQFQSGGSVLKGVTE